jgi:hypothetical protein
MNNYQASELIEIGKAQDVILGPKPEGGHDSLSNSFFFDIAVTDEEDEEIEKV